MESITIRSLEPHDLDGLTDVLVDCVEGGASVSFMLPLSRHRARKFWSESAAAAARGERVVLVAEDGSGAIIGTVSLILAQPENQHHRADIAKMLVHRRARHQGIGAALLTAVERAASDAGKTLLVLDTVTGTDAYRLYTHHGWQRCGEIPNYAHWPDGRPCPTTIFFKALSN